MGGTIGWRGENTAHRLNERTKNIEPVRFPPREGRRMKLAVECYCKRELFNVSKRSNNILLFINIILLLLHQLKLIKMHRTYHRFSFV